jgi:glutamate--cysteine ligase|tara:strand:+ start:242 stop:1531 length:1290 start_codon:yes stop_codon:yes gene_type:complete
MFINSKEDLINYFHQGAKKDLLIGVENEKFLFDGSTNSRATYSKVKDALHYLKKFGWKETTEGENLIGLKDNGKNISLEPGNQIELSGEKLKNIHEACSESFIFLDQMKKACKELDLKMMSIGFDPISKIENIPKNPKKRYEIMTKEMPKHGKLSLDMMYLTCGTQINLDYDSEIDFKKKFKLASYLTPISIALFANSSIKQMKSSNFISYRSKVWQSTSRGGLPQIFLEDMDFEKYADMSLNMPLLFILQNSKYINTAGKTFKDFINGNIKEIENKKPTFKDFETHLATIFTEVRLKKYIEIRSLDACEWDCHCAGPAFYTGLLYGNLDEAYEVINKWNKLDVMNAYLEAPKKGLGTMINNKSILEWSKILLNLSKKGLQKRNIKNKSGKDESIFLKNIENTLLDKKTKAEKTIEDFNEKKGIDFFYE